MPRHSRTRSQSGIYHIMLRGNERKDIFYDDEDRQRFIEILKDKKQADAFRLHAICLMNNHVHMMIGEGTEDVAKVMKRITVSYVYYFNKKYKRIGHLFQDRYKSEGVEDEGYILSLARYIHQNPLKAGMVISVGDYKWSSYNCYLDDKDYIGQIINKDMVLGIFSNEEAAARKAYQRYMNEKITETHMDIPEDEEMDELDARAVFEDMLKERGITWDERIKLKVPEELIREFKEITKLSIRKIAAITGLNKDKINRILRA